MLHLELLEDRLVPSAPTYHGGPILQDPQVATLFVGQYSQSFDQAISVATGDYTKNLGVFGVQSASRDGTVTIPYPGPLTNASLGNLLVQEINSGALPSPGPNQLYMICVQQASMPDVPNAGAYHTWTYDQNGTEIPFTVSFTVGSNAGTYGIFHEYAEAATDPFASGWYGNGYDQEIADLAGGASFTLDGFNTAASVVGPNGSLITGPTSYQSVYSSPPPSTSPPSTSWFNTFINDIESAVMNFDNAVASWVSSLEQTLDQIYSAELSYLETF